MNGEQKILSSQKSPHTYCRRVKKRITGTYPVMFVEDFCEGFSYDLSPDIKTSELFYKIVPENDVLMTYLNFEDNLFLEYAMDKIISNIMQTMLWYSKAYMEVVTFKNSEEDPKGIAFKLFNPIVSIKSLNKTYFLAIQQNNRIKLFSVDNNSLVIFKLKDMHYSKRYFKRLFKKLRKCDLTLTTDLVLSNTKTGFDYDIYRKKNDFNLLKSTRKIFWNIHGIDNQYLGDSYMLYRKAKFKMIKKDYLQYILHQMNLALEKHKEEMKFEGKICANYNNINYVEQFEKMQNGEINISQFCKIVLGI